MRAIIVLIVLILGFFVGGYCMEYSVEFWASYIKGVPVDVPFIPCAIGGMFLSSIIIPVAIVTWILSYCL